MNTADPAPIDYNYHYRKFHAETDAHYARLVKHYSRLFGDLYPTIDRGLPILDVGCGTGHFVHALRELGFGQVVGIDASREQIAVAVKRALPVEQIDDAAHWLARNAGRMGAIFALDLIEHIPAADQIAFLRAARTALCPGGRFVCTVPNANAAFASRMRYIDWTHRMSFTEISLDFLLHAAGFADIRISGAEYRPRLPLLIRPSVVIWLGRGAFRLLRRIELGLEFSFQEARRVPLANNLKAYCMAPR
ncbi:MAG: class I SAM-dependent methyltransferase [Burkholderiales bacterium]